MSASEKKKELNDVGIWILCDDEYEVEFQVSFPDLRRKSLFFELEDRANLEGKNWDIIINLVYDMYMGLKGKKGKGAFDYKSANSKN